MTLAELNRLLNQGFTAADLRSLGIIPAAPPEPQPEPQPEAKPEPKPEPQPEAKPEAKPDPMAALSAKLDALTGMFQAAARSNVNTGGQAKIIDPMDAGGAALAVLSGFPTDNK